MKLNQIRVVPNIEEAFDQFLLDKIAEGCSLKTAETYRGHFNSIGRYFDVETPIDQATSYLFKLAIAEAAETGISRNSIRSYTATLKSFFSWCRSEGLCDVQIKLYRGEETVPETYTDEELKRLLRRPGKRCSFAELRCWTIVNLLVNNGIRAASVRSIKNKDVLFDQNGLVLRHTKAKKTQVVPLSPPMVSILREYMRVRKGEPDDWLFPKLDGEQMTHNALRHMITFYNHKRGVEKTGIHMFRHTFARMYLVECGGNALKLQRLLGHSTLDMTKHYVKLFDQDLIDDFQKVSPLERIRAKK